MFAKTHHYKTESVTHIMGGDICNVYRIKGFTSKIYFKILQINNIFKRARGYKETFHKRGDPNDWKQHSTFV